MTDILKTKEYLHIPTNNKVPAANETLKAHKDYHLIEGVVFVSGTLTKSGRPALNYSTPEGFTEDQIALTEKIVNSLPSLG